MNRIHGKATQKASGFTLIELLVVVAIIVILASILIAALPLVRKSAYDASTRALLQSLSSDCDNYFSDCDAYPGPLPAVYPSGGGTAAASNKISGTQNMLLGLTYALYYCSSVTQPNNTTPQTVYSNNNPSFPTFANSYTSALAPSPPTFISGWQTVPGAGAVVNATDTTGPINYGASPIRNLKVYYPPAPKVTATVTTTNGWNAFPTIVDRYPDAMPILYYRKTAGVDGTAQATLNPNGNLNDLTQPNASISPGGSAIAATGNPSPFPSYYYDDNKEYTTASPLLSVSGQAFDQAANTQVVSDGGGNNFRCGLDAKTLAACISNMPASGTPNSTLNLTARGGFVLISAGYDHLYGMSVAHHTNDDIIVPGGH